MARVNLAVTIYVRSKSFVWSRKNTDAVMSAPKARPRPAGIGPFPLRISPAATPVEDCTSALDTASPTFKPKASKYDLSWMRVVLACVVSFGTGAGEAFLNVLRESL